MEDVFRACGFLKIKILSVQEKESTPSRGDSLQHHPLITHNATFEAQHFHQAGDFILEETCFFAIKKRSDIVGFIYQLA